jgi:hypothetical protein
VEDQPPVIPEELRDRVNRNRSQSNLLFALSFLIALGVHLALLLRDPTFELEVPENYLGPSAMQVPVDSGNIGPLFNVSFLAPEIFARDGTLRPEPPERVLEARHIDLSEPLGSDACGGRDPDSVFPVAGQVQVRVNEHGRVVSVEVRETTGNRCRDAIIAGIARSVWYRWLPNEDYPAPVELIQRMSVTEGGIW